LFAVVARTLAIGDIHGDLEALERLLAKLPALQEDDTVVFLGDYLDRGPHPAEVVGLVRAFAEMGPQHTVTLRGNHEDKWIESLTKPDLPYLVQHGNGCAHTYRSFAGKPPLAKDQSLEPDELAQMLQVTTWMPADVGEWLQTLPLYYEDEHAIYVHAGLDGEIGAWKAPSESRPKALLWTREVEFYNGYRGKRVIFGHSNVADLPDGNPASVWQRGDLFGIDTASGMGGFLSAIELPSMTVYDSR
jgi:serine/threonine protein phosphatase 1